MTICRHFQNGNCRYGQNCRFDHIYETNSRGNAYHANGNNYSNYHYNNPQKQNSGYNQGGSSFNFGQAALEVAAHKTQEINQVKQDLQDMIDGRFYPFTVIPGVTNNMNFSHLSDLSPEEVRLKAYESLATNTFQGYQSEMARHLNHVMQIMRQLIANPQLIQESHARPGAGPVVHAAGPSITQNMSSIFQPQSSSVVFPQPAFGIPNQEPSASISSDPLPRSVTEVSGKQMNQPDPSIQQKNDTTYTSMELLSANDLNAFRDRVFTLDNLPLVAPPKELCH